MPLTRRALILSSAALASTRAVASGPSDSLASWLSAHAHPIPHGTRQADRHRLAPLKDYL
jgi:hypothetical protein